jgi:DNA-binding response OmpR family regulator
MAKSNVLLVDNELLSRDLLTNHLQHEGFAVRVAADSAEALKILARKKYPLAIVSSGIGEETVCELIARIHKRKKDSLVYLLVSQAGAYDADRLVEIGAYDIIVRPFRLENVKLKMRNALELLALKTKAREFSEKLQQLENSLKRYETVKERVKIPDLSSVEIQVDEKKQDSRTVEQNHKGPSHIPAWIGDKEYRKQQRAIESSDATIEMIRQLDELHKAGILTEQEFKEKKKELLKRI